MVKKKPKKKKFSVVLSEREAALLLRFSKASGCSRPMALRRIVMAELRRFSKSAPEENAENQLNLFNVSHQTNLLDHIPSKNQ